MEDVAEEKMQVKATDDSGEASSSGASTPPVKVAHKKPIVIIVIGMAGELLSLISGS